jgi:hypothetical protein
MAKKLVLYVLIILSVSNISAQDKRYTELVNEALKLYQGKEYRNAGEKYSAAFREFSSSVQPNDLINAARSWAKTNETDSAFSQLILLAQNEDFQYFNVLKLHPDLKTLHSDKRWDEVIKKMIGNRRKTAPNLNYSIVEILDTVYYFDQKFRWEINEIEKESGWGSDKMKDLWKNAVKYDSINLIKVTGILDKHGWLGSDSLGIEGNSTLFLVIQHANIQTQEKYLPMMRDAVIKGNARAESLALLEDRVALRLGKRQIYGSQISRDDKTGKYYVMPLDDPDNVDKRREEVGLGPLREYVSEWGIIWNVEEYKKFLQEYEAK